MPSPPVPLRLEIDAHVIRQLGDELITDTGQALLELVKNSYDADASYCHIDVNTHEVHSIAVPKRPTNQDPSEVESEQQDFLGRITVSDDGEGMSLETIRRGWLTISMSPKRAFKLEGKTTEKFHRTPLGDKGLGRIGTLKLGSFVVIKTHHNPDHDGWRVSFSWSHCAEGGLLSEVPVVSAPIPPSGSTGTVLTIYGLTDLRYWQNERSLENLRSQLSTLISPFKTFESFDIRFTFDGKPAPIESAEDYLEAAQGKFSATWQVPDDGESEYLDVDGHVKLLLFRKTKNDPAYRQYIEPDKGRALFEYLKKDKRLSEFQIDPGDEQWFIAFRKAYYRDDLKEFFGNDRCADPGPLMVEIYDIDIVEAKSLVASKKTHRPRFLDTHHGVFIYRDNFRIRMGEDWLGLGQRQTRGGSYYGLRPGNTLGWVSISAKDNRNLVEKSDREGFIDNAAKRGFDAVLSIVTSDVNNFITACRRAYNDFVTERRNTEADRETDYDDLAALTELKAVATIAPRISATLSDASRWVSDFNQLNSELRQLMEGHNYSDLMPIVQRTESQVREWLDRSREIPRLTKCVTTIPHAVETIAEKYDADNIEMHELYALAATGLAAEGLVHEISDVVQALLNSLGDLERVTYVLDIRNAKFLSDLKSAQASGRDIVNRIHFMDPMLRNVRATRETINIKDLLVRYEKHKRPVTEQNGIALTIALEDDTFIIKANRGRVLQVLDNLVNNSIYWLRLTAKTQHGFKPTIAITADKPTIQVSDNGIGVDDRIIPRLFEPFVTGRTDASGHGLGLYLSQELLKQEKTTLTLLPLRNEHNRRYVFEIDFTAILYD